MAFAPDGTLYLVCSMYGFNMGRALVKSYDKSSQQWKPLSTNSALISDGEANHLSLALDKNGIAYVAYSDNSTQSKQITVTGYTPPSWHYVGQKEIPGSAVAKMLAIGPDNTPYIVFNDTNNKNRVTVMSYNKSSNQWSIVGQKYIIVNL